MNDKILITGATGLLGTDLMKVLKPDYRVMGVSSADVDICDYKAVGDLMERMKPDVVLHAAAWADVDGCEQNKEKAFEVNAEATKNIAQLCKNIGSRLIYYSTDYVFDGTKGSLYNEDDATNPINIYGQSKLKGEQYVLDSLDNAVVMRISWLYGTAKDCFVTKVIKTGLDQFRAKQKSEPYEIVKAVSDQYSCPTWTVDIADQTAVLIENDVSGIVHAVSYGEISRYYLAEHIFEELSWDIEMESASGDDFKMRAPRPARSGLENKRLNQLNLSIMRDFEEAVREFLMVHKEA